MCKAILKLLTVLTIGIAPALPALAGDALSPDEMQGYMQKEQAARQAEAAPRVYVNPRTGRTMTMPMPNDPMTTGSIAPSCLTGPPECTAAGYPNMRYYRMQQGGY